MAGISLFGASGMIGSRVLREALDRGHRVLALSRDPARITTRHDHLTVATADVLDPHAVTAAGTDQDVVVSAIGGGSGAGHRQLLLPATRSLVTGLRAVTDPPRLICVGGAGSLRTAGGARVWDAPGLPEPVLEIMHAHGDALDFLRTVTDLRWTSMSPAALIEPGERTGHYRTALDDLVVDGEGRSRISAEDYAMALVDEIESPRHLGERFTVGY